MTCYRTVADNREVVEDFMRLRHILIAIAVAVLGLGVPVVAAQNKNAGNAQVKIEVLPLQPYVAIRKQVSMDQLGGVISPSIGLVAKWLGTHSDRPSGAPFVRYMVIDMPKRLDIEVGFPVTRPTGPDAPVLSGAFPPGRYISYTYTGPYDGLVGANAMLLNWARNHHISLAVRRSKQGDVWGGRVEYYLTDPTREPDPKGYQTKILYLIAK